jgi:hypothetical protein
MSRPLVNPELDSVDIFDLLPKKHRINLRVIDKVYNFASNETLGRQFNSSL